MFTESEKESLVENFGSLYIDFQVNNPNEEFYSFMTLLEQILLSKLIHFDIYIRKIEAHHPKNTALEIVKQSLKQMEKLSQIKQLVHSDSVEHDGEWFNLFYQGLQVTLEVRLEQLENSIKTKNNPQEIEQLETEKEKFTELLEYAKQQPCAVPLYAEKS